MTVSLKHTFQSAKTDSLDATLVQPSNWNEEHELTLATNKVLGRATAGTGPAEELSIGTALSVSGGTLAVTNVPVANGGTGASTLTGYVKGNGTSAFTAAASVPVGDISGILPIANGGTALATLGTAGQVLAVNSGATALEYVPPPIGAEIIRVARTSNTQIGASNRSNLIDITSGTFTQTFAAAATLGNGWFCYLRNSGTGDITLDPNGAETIDGLTTYIMYPGECRLVQCDGTTLRTIVLDAFYRTFTASGAFTKPPGYTAFSGLLWGGGGSGCGGNGGNNPAGGGGGACNIFSLDSTFFSASCTVTIGAGGVSAISANGNVGGNSSFDSKVFAYGGAGGSGTFSGSGGGLLSAGSSSGGEPNPGGTGNSGFGGANSVNNVGLFAYAGGASGGGTNSNSNSYAGGNSVYGGAGGASQGVFASPAAGGVSIYGGNGGASADAAGVAGSAPGGGGGATRINGNSSGAGGRGELRIWGIV